MDRQRSRDYDVAMDYLEWSKTKIEEMEDTISGHEDTIEALKEQNTRLTLDVQQSEERVKELETVIDNIPG